MANWQMFLLHTKVIRLLGAVGATAGPSTHGSESDAATGTAGINALDAEWAFISE